MKNWLRIYQQLQGCVVYTKRNHIDPYKVNLHRFSAVINWTFGFMLFILNFVIWFFFFWELYLVKIISS